ncbi:MAG: PD-(D/E)XK nuclease family protein, partial [Halioglobus sp.]|nr:PD-(D/E)XK nuclease family protein [Halioglobus sp.]
SPSSIPAIKDARIGEIIELGERLEITGDCDPATLGSALHAVIATTILGQNATHRVLHDHAMHNTISVAAADDSAKRLIDTLDERFTPLHYYTEFPLYYTTADGQVVSGWIDLLVETPEGFVLIDHKASPRARSDWEKIALGYSGQLAAYADGINRAMDKPVIARYIHFAVTGGMVEVVV